MLEKKYVSNKGKSEKSVKNEGGVSGGECVFFHRISRVYCIGVD